MSFELPQIRLLSGQPSQHSYPAENRALDWARSVSPSVPPHVPNPTGWPSCLGGVLCCGRTRHAPDPLPKTRVESPSGIDRDSTIVAIKPFDSVPGGKPDVSRPGLPAIRRAFGPNVQRTSAIVHPEHIHEPISRGRDVDKIGGRHVP